MRKIGIYYAFWIRDWNEDFAPFIPKAKKLGFDILEIKSSALVPWTEEKRQELARTARGEGITLAYECGNSPERDISSPDAAVRENGLRFMREVIEDVGRMGGGVIEGSTYGCWSKRLGQGESKQAYLDRSVESLKKLAPVAEDCNVTIGCEALNRFEQFMLNTAAEAVPFVEEVGSPNVGVLLDTFHMNIEEQSFSDAIRLAGKHLVGFHCGEPDRKPVGMGRMPWKEIREALDAIGYQGHLLEEPFVLPDCQVGHDVSVWREIIPHPDLDRLAADSAAFMRRVLA